MSDHNITPELIEQLQNILGQLSEVAGSSYDENGEPLTAYLADVEPAWKPEKIFQLENGQPLDGGRDGHLNRPHRDLLSCIKWLRNKQDELAAAIPGTEQFETLVEELKKLDITTLEENLRYLQGYQTLTNRYAKDKFWVELFSARNTLAEVFEIDVEEAIVGSDCVDVYDTTGIEVGKEYLITDSRGVEEIKVVSKLTEHRFRTEQPLSRTYDEDAVIKRTSWALPNFGSMGGDAIAQTGEIYWSVPIYLNSVGREQSVYVGRDKEDGVLSIYYRDDENQSWVALERTTEVSISTTMRDVRYKLPAVSGALYLKIVCEEGPVQMQHVVLHLSFEPEEAPETPSVDWGQIFGDISNQRDLQNALNAVTPPDASTTKKGLVQYATDAVAAAGTSTVHVVNPKQLKDATPDATAAKKGLVMYATDAIATAGTSTVHAITPKQLKAATPDASIINRGLVQYATDAEATAGAQTDRAVTPKQLKAAVTQGASSGSQGVVQFATDAEAAAGTLTDRVINPKQLKAATPPDATTTTKGLVVMATDAIATAGTSTTHVINPKQLKAATPTATTAVKGLVLMATDTIATTGTSADHVVNPKQLKAATSAATAAIPNASTTTRGLVLMATDAEAAAGTSTTHVINPKQLKDLTPDATNAIRGLVQYATDTEATAGTSTLRVVNPKQLKAATPSASTSARGLIEIATDAEATAGTLTTHAVTPKQLKDAQLNAMPVGTIIWSARNTPPAGFLECNGAAISRTTYAALFSAIGITYGSGNGSSTFLLPDLRDEFIRGKGSSRALGSKQDFAAQKQVSGNIMHALSNNVPMTYLGMMKGTPSQSSALAGNIRIPGLSNMMVEYNSNFGLPAAEIRFIAFNADTETRPRNIALLPCIKY